jgi:hypothetical protein
MGFRWPTRIGIMRPIDAGTVGRTKHVNFRYLSLHHYIYFASNHYYMEIANIILKDSYRCEPHCYVCTAPMPCRQQSRTIPWLSWNPSLNRWTRTRFREVAGRDCCEPWTIIRKTPQTSAETEVWKYSFRYGLYAATRILSSVDELRLLP